MNYKHCHLLVDTGCARSCVSESFMQKMKLKLTPLDAQEPSFLISANKSQMQNIGTVELGVCVQGLTMYFTFCVLTDLVHPCIIGIDFLVTNKAQIDCTQKILTLHDGLIVTPLCTRNMKDMLLLLEKPMIIPAHSEAMIPVTIPKVYKLQTSIVEPYLPLKNRMIALAPAIIDPKTHRTFCRVLNLSDTDQKLKIRTPIACISSIDLSNEFNGTQIRKQTNVSKTTNPSNVTTPNHQERVKILKDIGLSFEDTKLTETQFEKVSLLLYQNRLLFAKDMADLPGSDLILHEIKVTTNKVIRQRRFHHPPHIEAELQRQCDQLLKAGILEHSDSPYDSPAFLVKKQNGSLRKVVDFRAINKITEASYFPMQSIEDCISLVGEEAPAYFSLCDQRSGFWSLKLHPDSRKYTAFSTARHHLQYTRLSMGLTNSPVSYMAALSKLLHSELASRAVLYADDLLLFTNSFEGHLQLLETVFAKFDSANLRMNAEKCKFFVNSLVFIGFRMSKEGISVDSSRFDVIKNYPKPTNAKQVRSFLGLVLFFKRFIKSHCTITAPLRKLLQLNEPFNWNEEHDRSFQTLKDAILSETVLIYPRLNEEFTVHLDASKHGLGFALSQKVNGIDKFISFNGRSTRKYEQNYSATNLELTAMTEALTKYHQFLSTAKHFTIKTDHMSLKHIKDLKHGPSRLSRYAVLFSQYNYTIEHVPGHKNLLCDSLSRRPYPPENEGTKFETFGDLDPQNHLASIDVEQLYADTSLRTRDPIRKRRRNLAVITLAPIESPIQTSQGNEDNEDDVAEALTTEEAEIVNDQIHEKMGSLITLESQSDCPLFASIIAYLQNGSLPRDREEARRVIIQSENYVILDNRLFHLARLRGKRLHKIRPLYQQLCIPRAQRLKVMETYHNLSHAAFVKCYLTIRQQFYWMGLSTDLAMYCKTCTTCQMIKATPHAAPVPLTSMPVRSLFETIHLDHHDCSFIKGSTHPYRYILIITDSLSLNTIFAATKTQTAAETAKVLWERFICLYGTPRYIVTDRAAGFRSNLQAELAKLCNFTRKATCPFKASTNSVAEQRNKSIILYLRAFCPNQPEWPSHLCAIEAAHRAQVNSATGLSPYELMYGFPMKLNLQWEFFEDEIDTPQKQALAVRFASQLETLRAIIQENLSDCHIATERKHNKNAKPHTFNESDRVYLRAENSIPGQMTKHNPLYTGPYIILELKNNIAKLQSIYSGKTLKSFVNVSKLRKVSDDRDILYSRLQPIKRAQSRSTHGDVINTDADATSDNPQRRTSTSSDGEGPVQQANRIPEETQTNVPIDPTDVSLQLQSNTQLKKSWPEMETEHTVHVPASSGGGATSQLNGRDPIQTTPDTESATQGMPRGGNQQLNPKPCRTEDVLPPAEEHNSTGHDQLKTVQQVDQIPHTAATPRLPANSSQQRDDLKLITAIRGKKMLHRKAYYKVIFEGDDKPHWISGDKLPSNIVIEYNVELYKKKQKAKARKLRSFNQH